MRRHILGLASVVIALLLSGCGANHVSIFRSYSAEGAAENPKRAQSVLIDAKQRAILATPAHRAVYPTGSAQARNRDYYVCAEPSPDALSAISSTFAASLGGILGPGKEVQGSLANAIAETASQLGQRNATIQLLRDGLYRQCEAYMNGLIDKDYYEQIANKYVNAMVTLLAIEELTPSAAKAVAIKAEPGAVVSADTKVELSTNAEKPSAPKPEPAAGGAQPPAGGTTAPEQPGAGGTTAPEQPGGGPAAQPPAGDGAQEQKTEGSSTGAAKAPPPTVNVNLPDNQVQVEPHISTAVNTMVTWFLTKDTVDYCLRGLFSGATGGDAELKRAFIDVCQQVILKQMTQQGDVAAAFSISAGSGTFGTDTCADAIRAFWRPVGATSEQMQTSAQKIEGLMREQGVPGSISLLLNTAERAGARRKVGSALGLAACK